MTTAIRKSGQELVCQLAYELHGIDLSGFSPTFIHRRLELMCSRAGLQTIAELKNELVNNESFSHELHDSLTVNTTSMFRDPEFYRWLMELLKNKWTPGNEYRIWHPGCSTGEEVFSLAILLEELDLLRNTSQFGTDISHNALCKARAGAFPAAHYRAANRAYLASGGSKTLHEYISLLIHQVLLKPTLKQQMRFSHHHLGKDAPFHEFDLVVCRNMFIYYEFNHQRKLLQDLHASMKSGAILCLGKSESISMIDDEGHFECLSKANFIYQKK